MSISPEPSVAGKRKAGISMMSLKKIKLYNSRPSIAEGAKGHPGVKEVLGPQEDQAPQVPQDVASEAKAEIEELVSSSHGPTKPPHVTLNKALKFLEKFNSGKKQETVREPEPEPEVVKKVEAYKETEVAEDPGARKPSAFSTDYSDVKNVKKNNGLEIPTSTAQTEKEQHKTTSGALVASGYSGYEALFEAHPSPNISHSDLMSVKKTIISQLTGKLVNFPNLLQSTLLEKYQEVYKMFEHTIKDHEGHSALLIGPRALGKTAIIQRALDELDKIYSDEFIVIRLNAYHQTDENTALREIARQLDKNLKRVRGNTKGQGQFGNFEQRSLSDTFANILSILDKNEKDEEESHPEVSTRTVSIIFVIEEFEKFTLSSKQTLLYNLFDLSQNSSTPCCIVGVSTKITTRELLEKRVRLRFSQRIITINKPKTQDEYWGNAKLGLHLSNEDIQGLEFPDFGHLWNDFIDFTYNIPGLGLRRLVTTNYYSTKNYKDFNNCVLYAISVIKSTAKPFPNHQDFTRYLSSQSINNIQSITKSLSELELLLTIAAARWLEKSSLQVINFNIALREYEEMMKQYNISATAVSSSHTGDGQILTNFKINQRIWPANILKNCWENLYKLELLLEPSIEKATSGYNAGVVEDTHMVQLDVTLEELNGLVDDMHFAKKLTKL